MDELMQSSGAAIDRLLKPANYAYIPNGLSTTKAGPMLRDVVPVRKAGDEHEQGLSIIERRPDRIASPAADMSVIELWICDK